MKTGSRMLSATCATEVMVVRGADVVLECGGLPMVGSAADRGTTGPVAELAHGTILGKRYAHQGSGLQVLCVKAGAGTLSIGGEALVPVETKQLPSSD
ncbi:hypothetical protein [Nocardioides sp. AE5]|uniref:hypothetical protein n=1 Tax=Nocardioides sp. AE5 TaxID=2962573 RepID=UPI002882D10F|nr:hypothetical protein [Nocardioides sp. AE5]MDT0202693.1 hypothetical protein [Nocardioides sp. AE5]